MYFYKFRIICCIEEIGSKFIVEITINRTNLITIQKKLRIFKRENNFIKDVHIIEIIINEIKTKFIGFGRTIVVHIAAAIAAKARIAQHKILTYYKHNVYYVNDNFIFVDKPISNTLGHYLELEYDIKKALFINNKTYAFLTKDCSTAINIKEKQLNYIKFEKLKVEYDKKKFLNIYS